MWLEYKRAPAPQSILRNLVNNRQLMDGREVQKSCCSYRERIFLEERFGSPPSCPGPVSPLPRYLIPK